LIAGILIVVLAFWTIRPVSSHQKVYVLLVVRGHLCAHAGIDRIVALSSRSLRSALDTHAPSPKELLEPLAAFTLRSPPSLSSLCAIDRLGSTQRDAFGQRKARSYLERLCLLRLAIVIVPLVPAC